MKKLATAPNTESLTASWEEGKALLEAAGNNVTELAFEAALSGRARFLEWVVRHDPHILDAQTSTQGENVAHWAVRNGNIETLKVLAKYRPELFADENKFGDTPREATWSYVNSREMQRGIDSVLGAPPIERRIYDESRFTAQQNQDIAKLLEMFPENLSLLNYFPLSGGRKTALPLPSEAKFISGDRHDQIMVFLTAARVYKASLNLPDDAPGLPRQLAQPLPQIESSLK